jgi:hypothetical protein
MAIAVIGALVGGALLWWARSEWSQHRLAVAVSIGGWGVLVAGGAVMAFLMNAGLLSHATSWDADGLTVLPSRGLELLARVLLVAMAVCGVDVAEFSHRQQTKWLIASALFAVVGLASCPRWFGRVGPLGYLQLSPWGVEYAQGFGTVHLSWPEIADVVDDYPSSRKMPCPITFRLSAGGLKVFVPGAFGSDPAEIFWMVRHYWQTPDRRGELCGGHAVARLSGRDFSTALR